MKTNSCHIDKYVASDCGILTKNNETHPPKPLRQLGSVSPSELKKNVYLVNLGTGTDQVLLPLAIGLISSYAMSVPLIKENFKLHLGFIRGEPNCKAEEMDDPVIVGLSLYVWNKRASLLLAAEVKRLHPHALVVVGGYSVPAQPQRIQGFFDDNPQVDVIVHGEGEFTFADILIHMAGDGDLTPVEAISFRGEYGEMVKTPQRRRIDDLNEIPSPFLDGTFDRVLETYSDRITGATWETNRGCPFSCSFCDWGKADVSKIKRFDLDRLKAEIKWISENNLFYVTLADANFGIFYDRDLEIAETAARLARVNGYPGFMAMSWTKNSHQRLIKIAEAFSCGGIEFSVTLAMQSFNEDTLAAIGRKNIKQDSMIALKKEYHDKNLPTYIDLILGLPQETYDSFVEGLNQAMTPRLADHWICHLCTLLENTEMASDEYRKRYGIVTRICAAGMARHKFYSDAEPELEEIVVGTSNMPLDDWRRAYLMSNLCSAFYNFRSAFFVMNYLNNELGTAYTDFVQYIIKETTSNQNIFPHLYQAVEHVRYQCRSVVNGISLQSSIKELGGQSTMPNEAAFALLLDDVDALESELAGLAKRYCCANRHPVNDEILAEVVRYQILRMPTWERRNHTVENFQYSVPAYFDALIAGDKPSPIVREDNWIEVQIVGIKANTREAFASQRTRSGHCIHIHGVRSLGGQMSTTNVLSPVYE